MISRQSSEEDRDIVTEAIESAAARNDEDDDDGMEAAHLAGMEGGVDAFNDAIGSSLTGPPDCPSCLRPRVAGHHGCYCEDD